MQIYVVNFSGPHRRLGERGLVNREDNQYQYRFRDIVDLDSGKHLFTIEHEVRSLTHPMCLRPLVNRNPAQTARNYRQRLRPGVAGRWSRCTSTISRRAARRRWRQARRIDPSQRANAELPRARRALLCRLPLREKATQNPRAEEWVRGHDLDSS